MRCTDLRVVVLGPGQVAERRLEPAPGRRHPLLEAAQVPLADLVRPVPDLVQSKQKKYG